MSSNAYQWQRITCEEQIKYLINLRQRFCQVSEKFILIDEFYLNDLELLDTSLIECICDLVNIHESFSNEASRKFLVELKCQQSIYTNDTLDQSVKRIYFNRRYRALINSREILLDDLSTSIEGNKLNRMIKIRAVCVLDEELNRIQEVLTSKSIEEQLAIRLHQIRATINVYFKQSSQTSFEDLSAMTLLVHSCDSLLSLFRLLFNSVNSDASFNSSLDIQREYK
ncbi:unnamed protein product [Rotaria magnacalcarata]|uniref:Uncharacterized protein n=1 Tax=Rotaria magnacalcarata TaxID=392030 RepID=A0A818WX26_9BILA|nr:unnamed protein product [Rotaria magnacalcarata]CAF3820126.1 unnamed protein product [Rotaria magnacalcarata]CAF3834436.1 unnamed protein product [Rotaria magnacalcarata]CAF3871390.1 unnamed protein product [Rotaria magnacalcarata]